VLKLPLAKVEAVTREADETAPGSGGAWAAARVGAWVLMREGGLDAPYVHDRSGPALWRFALAFAQLPALLVRGRGARRGGPRLTPSPDAAAGAAGHQPAAALGQAGGAGGGRGGARGGGDV